MITNVIGIILSNFRLSLGVFPIEEDDTPLKLATLKHLTRPERNEHTYGTELNVL